MIAFLSGTIIYRDNEKSSLIIDTGGVGYEVFIPSDERGFLAFAEGKYTGLFIYTYIREDRIVLYGFSTSLQRDIFSLLLDVKDVGPRLAVTVLSGIDAKNFLGIITTQDVSALSKIKGIGQAKSERIVMELKNKILKKPSLMNDINGQDLLKYCSSSQKSTFISTPTPNKPFMPSGALGISASLGDAGSSEILDSSGALHASDYGSNASAPSYEPSDTEIIFESSFALEALGYSRSESFSIAGKVYKALKNPNSNSDKNSDKNTDKKGASAVISTEYLTKQCLKYIYELKEPKNK